MTDAPAPRSEPRRLGYQPALDGLRAFAVVAVLLYHGGVSWAGGGFLGVTVFFVLSGFLLTTLLLRERRQTGNVDLGAFWGRRVRRLAPAALACLSGIVLLDRMHLFGTQVGLDGDVTAALLQVANWRLLLGDTSYGDLFAAPSPTLHFWSLSLEEQFYLTLAVAALLLLRRSVRRFGLFVLAAVAATWVAMVPLRFDVDLVYYSPLRFGEPLLGCFLAVFLFRRSWSTWSTPLTRWAPVAAGAGLAVLMITAEAGSPTLGGGVLQLAALLSAAVVLGAVLDGPVNRWLAVPLLVAAGRLSYGLYLYHWPVYLVLTPERTRLDGVLLLALRLLVTFGVAVVSYRYLERPVIERRRLVTTRSLAAVPAASLAIVGIALLPSSTGVTATAGPPALPPIAAAPPAAAATERTPTTLGVTRMATVDEPERPSTSVTSVPSPPDIALLGDSVAFTLAGGTVGSWDDPPPPWDPSLSPVDPARLTVRNLARPGCSFLPGQVAARDRNGRTVVLDLSERCGDWRTALMATGSDPPDALVLALSNELLDRVVDGKALSFGEPEVSAAIDAFLGEVWTAVQPNTELVLLGLPRSERFGDEWNEGGWRERTLLERYQAFAAAHPGTRVIDLAPVVCPLGDCSRPFGAFDPAWRYDGLHYTRDGARSVLEWLLLQMPAPA
jgi:peptidoglycan/LPS O-acetylase OafA/YrhL